MREKFFNLRKLKLKLKKNFSRRGMTKGYNDKVEKERGYNSNSFCWVFNMEFLLILNLRIDI